MKTIEFVDPTETHNLISPWSKPKPATFDDRVLKPEYQVRHLRFAEGSTWFRILPTIKPSMFAWCMPLQVLNYPGGRFLHPRSLNRGAKSAFDHAYQWLRENNPGALYSKANITGIRLLTDRKCLCWVLLEEEEGVTARLLLESDYDSSRGGVAGLGQLIWRATRDVDETGTIATNAIDSNAGVLVMVEKKMGKGAKFPSYSVRLGRQPAPIAPMLEKMDPKEREVLTPIENVVHVPSADEEWEFLAKVMAQEHVDKIRASVT